MKNVKSLFMVGLGALALASCNKEEVNTDSPEVNEVVNNRAAAVDIEMLGAYVEMTEIPKNDEFTNFYHEMTETRKQVFNVSANEPVSIEGANGTRLICGENNFVYEWGGVVEGEIQIEMIEVFNKADMILLDKATSGVTEDGAAIDALISGGEIFVRATQGGSEVNLMSPMRVEVPTTSPDTDMIKFVEIDQRGDNLLWGVAEDPAMRVEEDRKGEGEGNFVTAYDILPGEWGWTNIDKWASDPCAKTEIFVEVPGGHDPSNTEVYLSYDGEPGRLANFDTWDGSRFSEHYGQICIGLDCHFVAVTNVGGSLEYAIQAATITSGHTEVISSFTPISEAALIAAINALP